MNKVNIIKNAMVVDVTNGTSAKRTLYIRDGKFVDATEETGAAVIDVEGCYAAPGFVDSHVHVFMNHAAIFIEADTVGVQQGVLTVVDAGSTGIRDFPYFEKEVIQAKETDVRFFLNIARSGLCDGQNELSNMDDLMTVEELLNFKHLHGRQLVGLKVRMSSSVVQESGIKPLIYARELSDQVGLPLMIHIGNAPPGLDEILNLLKKGDIVTHCFHGKPGGISDYPEEFRSAVQRGVHFDLGHGAASFSSKAMLQVREIGFVDFSISTDLYGENYITPVGSLMDTMSKLLAMGYTVEDLTRRVTALPRSFLNLPAAKIETGQPADLTLFRIVEKPRELVDAEGVRIPVDRYFYPAASIKQGRQVWHDEL